MWPDNAGPGTCRSGVGVGGWCWENYALTRRIQDRRVRVAAAAPTAHLSPERSFRARRRGVSRPREASRSLDTRTPARATSLPIRRIDSGPREGRRNTSLSLAPLPCGPPAVKT